MVELSGRAPGVSIREIDLTGPQNATPVGTPAGIIGTAERGPAFVPITFATLPDFTVKFGESDGTKYGPIAVAEWLRNAKAATYLRVLGAGKAEKRLTSGDNAGSVESAGFVVGARQPLDTGFLGDNPYAAEGAAPGRLYFLGAYMSESIDSTVFSDAGIQVNGDNNAHPIIRGVVMAASGVVLKLQADSSGSVLPTKLNARAESTGPYGEITGTVDISSGNQNFILLLNGHKDTTSNRNIITASFDQTAPNYFGNVLNADPFEIETAGHYLYTSYDVHPTSAVVTGSGITSGSVYPDQVAFLTTGSAARNAGAATIPSYENFEDRFTTPATPTIISQKFGGNARNLFRVHALSDGRESNTKFKISIQNVVKSMVDDKSYGTFDLIVRDFYDTDENRVILEQFPGLSLNPRDDNYIARRVGDMHAYYDFDKNEGNQKLVVDGQYPNVSKLIRVSIESAVDTEEIDPTALPIGFRGPYHLVTSGTDPLTAMSSSIAANANLTDTGNNSLKRAVEPPVPFRENITVGTDPKKTGNKQLYWGVQFEQKTSLAEPNASRVRNKMVANLTKYFPDFQTSNRNVHVGENAGTADAGGTVLDSDRFNNNLFSLDRIQVLTSSGDLVNVLPDGLISMSYVRDGLISANAANKTRALTADDLDTSFRPMAKFSFYIQRGFDGTSIFDRETDALTNSAIKQEMDDSNRGQNNGPTVKSYAKAMEIMGNTSDVDIKLLAIPGVRNSVSTDVAIDTVESDRFDALYIMDIEERDTLNTVVTSSVQDVDVTNTANAFSLRGLDSNFAAAYFPDVIMQNPYTNLPTQVPPSVVVLGAFALNDALAFPWFAPAGFARGALQSTDRTALNLSRANIDALADVDVNAITAFPSSDGTVVWGQKTLQAAQSALDRVNVRRLLIEIRRQVRTVANTLLFEPNREETLNRFNQLVIPIMQRIQEQQGVTRFKVVIDATTTTQADVENNTLRGKIYVEPTRTAEVVSIDFVVTNAGDF